MSGGPYSRGFGLTQERTKGGFDALIKAAERDAKRNRQERLTSTTDSSITPSDNVPLGEGTLTRRGIRRRIPSSDLPEIFDEGQIEGFLQATEDRRIARLKKEADQTSVDQKQKDQSSEATTQSEFIDKIIEKRGLATSGVDEEEIIESAKTSRLPGILGADPVLGGLALARLGAGISQGDIGKGLVGATDVVLQERKLAREELQDAALRDYYKSRAS